ncbi:hypothetical protein [Pseudovibrio sp. POLY-S9]|uniref:hypothetical protein n=1 Tax=Pseudovibrio sp. POLY-S9 TaxID=1576596 RepID=UPI000708C477|nr:hypothetical protein [Pseudovibrio sp. POLY-S9]
MVVKTYKNILSRGIKSLDSLNRDEERLRNFTAAHNDATDLGLLKLLIGDRPEVAMYEKALVEYEHALASVASGHYRQANNSLRLFAELSLSTILFSANEIHLRLWLMGRKDINWKSVTCLESGVFSKEFANVFFPDLADFGRQYQAIAVTFYRECSEFVHGNPRTYESDQQIAFKPDLFDDWNDRASAASRVVKFAFILRYTSFADTSTLRKIEPIVLEEFATVQPLQTLFGRPQNA